uniref:RNA binding protein n=1 Tax=Solanum tuberosum TaxID=4113 RepID=M1CR71_SOLTU
MATKSTRHAADKVATAFVVQYYNILQTLIDQSYRFYKEKSVLSWPSSDGETKSVTTSDGISDFIMSSHFKGSKVEVKTIDSQLSVAGGVLVIVMAYLIGQDKSRKGFSQTFFLAPQETGYYVFNDIFRFIGEDKSSTIVEENGSIATPLATQSKAENNVDDEVDQKPSSPKEEEQKKKAPVAPVIVENEAPKITYASMIKQGRSSPPKNVGLPSAPKKPQPNNFVQKSSSGDVLKVASTPSTRDVAQDNYHNDIEYKSIFVGGLLPNTTKNDLYAVVKEFGPLHIQDVQLKAYEVYETHHIMVKGKRAYMRYKRTNKGLPNGMTLFYMGIVSGMMSAVIANRKEIEKVNEKFKWTKSLVQELEEELNVKEIANDDYEDPNLYSLSMSTVDEPTRQTSEAEKHESMSEIEAELEAELERLEMSLKVSTFERISDFVELDPEDEINVVQGDLKLDCLSVQSPDSSESDSHTNGTWIVHSKPANYPVSPRELSSRLHEVIESRLEARIKELETDLYHSQNRVCSLETQHNLSQKDFASRESESSECLQSSYWYHEADEETIRIMHGSENAFDTNTRIPPFDGGLIDSPNEKKGGLVHERKQPTLMQLLKTESMAQTRELQVTRKQHYHCSKVPIH